MKKTDGAALALLIVGGLNWGLIAIARFDLVAAIFGMDFGETSAITRVVYGLVGVSALWVAARAATLLGVDRRRAAVPA